MSRDPLEHRLAPHLATARTTCPSLTTKHTLRHTAAMNLLSAGVDVSVIALWLGHADTHSTDVYLHADMAIKQAAINRTRPPNVKPGNYQPEPDILTSATLNADVGISGLMPTLRIMPRLLAIPLCGNALGVVWSA